MFSPFNLPKIRIYPIALIILAVFMVIFLTTYSKAQKDYQALDVLNTLNSKRLALAQKPLLFNDRLNRAASLKAQHMFSYQYFDHYYGEVTPWDFIYLADYDYRFAGENLAINYTDAREVTDAWMASETHKKNILNQNFDHAGIAILQGELNGKHATITVSLFGKEKTSSVSWMDIPLTKMIKNLLGV